MYSIKADLWNFKKYSVRIKHQRHICYLSNLIAYLWGTAWVFNIFSGAGVNFEFPKSLLELGADMIHDGTLSNVTLDIEDGHLDGLKQE